MGNGSDGLDSRRRREASEKPVEELPLLMRFRIPRRRQVDRHDEHALRGETRIGGDQPEEAVDHQSSAREEHERQCRFGGHENDPEAPAARIIRGSVALAQPPRMLACAAQGRRETSPEPGESRHDGGRNQRLPVHSRRLEQRDLHRRQRRDCVDDPGGEQDACGPAGRRHEQALDEQLPHQPSAGRAERRPYGQLFLPARATRQQQVHHVRACDEQHEARGRDERQHRGPDVADHRVAQDTKADVMSGVVAGILPGEARRDRRQIRGRLVEGHVGAQPRDRTQVVTTNGADLRRDVDRDPRICRQRFGEWRQDADDFVRLVVQKNLLADHRGVPPELPAPEIVAQDHDAIESRAILAGSEDAAVYRRNAKQ